MISPQINNSTNGNELFLRFLMLAFMLASLGNPLKAQPFFKSPALYDYTNGSYGGNIAGVSIDMDGDGDLDIVGMEHINAQSQEIIVAINDGNGIFDTSSKRTGQRVNRDFAVGDLNNDGLPDIVVVGEPYSWSYKVMLNVTLPGGIVALASTIYTEGPPNQRGEGVSIADLNNDGNNDFIITKSNSSSRELSVFLGDGSGENWVPTQYVDVPNSIELERNVIGDFDGDGILDVVANRSGGSKTLYFFKGNSSSGIPTGTFHAPVSFSSSVRPYKIRAVDINEDGLLDIVVNEYRDGRYNILINVNDNDGTSYTSTTITAYGPSNDDARGITMHDMDGDGHLDLLASDGSFVTGLARVFLLKGNGDGTFQPATTYGYSQSNPNADGVTVGDYNGDGLVDIASMDRDLWVFINRLETVFSVDQSGTVLNNGDTHDVGLVSTGGNSGPISFTITNKGNLDGTLNGTPKVVIGGADASMFTVDESSTGSNVPLGGTTTFTVTFTPSSGGNKTATLTIPSSDLSSPYTINLTAKAPKDPDGIDVGISTICTGAQTTLTQLNGILDFGEDWVWYSNSCGGTQIGTGASVIVTPSTTTSYFIRSENAGTPTSSCVNGQVIVDPNTVINITAEPASSIGTMAGETQILTVLATGTNTTYQWFKNDVPIVDGGRFSGSQTNTLTITILEESDEDTYTCTLSNSCSQATTGDIALSVLHSPPVTTCGTILNFDGQNDYVNLGDVLEPTNITLEAWVNATNVSGRHGIVGKPFTSHSGPYYQYHLSVRDGGDVYFAISVNGTLRNLRAENAILINTWHHIAASYDGSVMKIYVDGLERASTNTSGGISNYSTPLTIGASSGFEFSGKIDEVRIWNLARSSTEIQSAFTTELQGNESGLIGYWDFNDGGGSTLLTDITSNGNNGILTNMDPATDWLLTDGSIGGDTRSEQTVDLNSQTSYDWNGNTYTADGTYMTTIPNSFGCDSLMILHLSFHNSLPPNTLCGTVLGFDGSNDYVDLGDVIEPTNITLEAWVNASDVSGRHGIVGKSFSPSAPPYYQYHLSVRDGGDVYFAISANGSLRNLRATDVISTNTWYHIAASYDGSVMKIYVDGVEAASNNVTGDIRNYSTPLIIGASSGFEFSGRIDEVRIWDVGRSQTEIANNKDIQLQGNETNLVGYWDFNGGVGSTQLADITSNGNDGILTNMDPATDWLLTDGSIGGDTRSEQTVDLNSQTSYDWNGNTYTADGTYMTTIPNSFGCDSLMTLHLSFQNSLPPNTLCGTVLGFDGSNDYVDLGDVIEPTNITLEAWVNASDVSGRHGIVGKSFSPSAPPYYQYHLSVRDGGDVYFAISANGSLRNLRATDVISTNTWYHIAASYDGSVMKIYVDGVEAASNNVTGDIRNYSTPLIIGASSGFEFSGRIDEVRIWDVGRSQTEIANNKDIQLQGNETNLVGYWDFNDGVGSTHLTDITANGNDGALTNMDPTTDWLLSDGSIGGDTRSEQTVDLIGQTSYDWNGNTYIADGTYMNTVPNSFGCDSLMTLHLSFEDVSPPNTLCGTVLDFDGSNDYIDLGDVIEPANITLEAWVNASDVSGRHGIVGKSFSPSAPPYYQYHLSVRDGGDVYFAISANGSLRNLRATDAITTNTWYHIAASYDGSVMKIYVDGVEAASNNVTGDIRNYSTPLIIGASSGFEFSGRIDEVRIWDVGRSQTEIVNNKDIQLMGNESGLMGYWNFNDGVGSTHLTDITANGNDGTLTNMDPATDWLLSDGSIGGDTRSAEFINIIGQTSYDWNGSTYTADGTYMNTVPNSFGCDSLMTLHLSFEGASPPNTSVGTVLDFDGSNDHVDLGDVLEPTNITLEAWVNASDVSGRHGIVGKPFTSHSGPYYQYHLSVRDGGDVYFAISANGSLRNLRATDAITTNTWYHIAASYDGVMMKIYVDGVEAASANTTGNISNYSTPLTIGASSGFEFSGRIDEVRIWDVGRSQTEIVNNKDIQLMGNESELIGYWNFDDGTGSTILSDITSNGNDGVLTNMDPQTDWVFPNEIVGGASGNTAMNIDAMLTMQGSQTTYDSTMVTERDRAIEKGDELLADVKLYPIPFHTDFKLVLPKEATGTYQLVISRLDGKQIIDKQLDGRRLTHQIHELSTAPVGIYILQLIKGDQVKKFKVLKINK